MMRFLSLFSGIDAASVALLPLGWVCVGFAEIEPAPCSVLAHHYPHVPNLGDVCAITDERIAALGQVDVVIGGSPCQDLSVAGKRRGLAGARSSLFHEQVRIFHAARTLCGARWLLWENVPGAFSSNRGRDFAAVVGTMAGCEFDVPRDGWRTAGAAVGAHGLVEWRVLDAQFFGLAQRRKRVFALLDTGDWAGRPPVLLEPEGLRGDSPPRRETREGIAVGALAGTSPGGGWRVGADEAAAGQLIAAFGGGANCQLTDVATALHAHPGGSRLDFLTETFIAFDLQQVTSVENRSNPRPGDPCHTLTARSTHSAAIAFSCKDHAADAADELAPTLRAMGHGASHANAGGQVAVAFHPTQDPISSAELSHALNANANATVAVSTGMAVRRLTPEECCLLQGYPRDYFDGVLHRGKPLADGPKYKALGNSFPTNVIAWIGERIQSAARWQIAEAA